MKKKRNVIGKKRDEYLNKINTQNTSISYLKRTKANLVMNFGEFKSSHMPSLNAFRVIRYEFKKMNQLQ